MKLKKFVPLLLSLVTLFAFSVSAHASEPMSTRHEFQPFNEYDRLVSLQKSSPEELKEMGLTAQDVNTLTAQFETALAKRAALPDSDLEALGYTEKEIPLLHAYANGEKLSDAALRTVTGTCTGHITRYSFSSTPSYSTFSYGWEWDHCPLITLSDAAAMKWFAYDSQGYEIDITKTFLQTEVNYYNDSQLYYTRSGTQQPNVAFNEVNLQFPMIEKYVGDDDELHDAYAKDGEITVTVQVDSSVSNNVNYIKVAGLYGHTRVGIGSPTLSVGATLDNLSFSASPQLTIDSTGAAKAQIGPGTTFIDLL